MKNIIKDSDSKNNMLDTIDNRINELVSRSEETYTEALRRK